MPFCIDCYTLVKRRDKKTAIDFLDAFLPERRAHLAEHHLPRDAEPAEVVLYSDEAAMEYLEVHPDEPYVVYTVTTGGGEPSWGMIGYTRDGSVVLGLSIKEDAPETAARLFDQLKAFAGTDHGFCGVEVAPPESEAEYEEEVASFKNGSWLLDAG